MLRKGVKLLIKKMVDYKKALVAILENTLENVNAGNTNITEEEASVIIDHLTMLNKGVATVTNARVSELEKEVAVLRATRPYQDALIQAAITRVAEQADFNLFRRTCRMITGEVVLPNTPTVTGYPAYNPYSCPAQSAPAPAN